MSSSSLSKKLLVKPGNTLLAIDAPGEYASLLAPLPEGVRLAKAPGKKAFDVVHLFVVTKKDLDRRAKEAIAAVGPNGILWISYPKKTAKVKTDMSRDVGWKTMSDAGWGGVSLVAIDDTWSAMRFKSTGKPVAPKKTRVAPPPKDGRFIFDVVLKGGESASVCYFDFPYDVLETFGTRARVPVAGTLNGFAFRSSLSPMGGPRHLMPVNAELRAGAKCAPGDTVHVELARDTAPRTVESPADLVKAIAKSAPAKATWAKLAFTHKKEYAQWIEGAKKPETRARRVAEAAIMLAKGVKRGG